MAEYTRDPCPYRILDDCGGAFSMGVVGGSIFHSIKGFRNSPSGNFRRMYGSLAMVREKAPITGRNFAVWGFLFSSIECMCVSVRKKEDPWNSIFSGAATGFALSFRDGLKKGIASAVVGGVLLGMIEGMGILFTKFSAEQFNPANRVVMEEPPAPPTSQQGGSTIFGSQYQ